jgi:hypothetical protein
MRLKSGAENRKDVIVHDLKPDMFLDYEEILSVVLFGSLGEVIRRCDDNPAVSFRSTLPLGSV